MGDEELLWNAVSEAVAPIAHLESQWDSEKLQKKLREYFKKAAKGLQVAGKPWDFLINEYADSVFSSIFCGLGDRDWLTQADFLLCVDAAIKDLFDPRVFAGVPQQVFEQTVLQATDRAFDEQRYWTVRWETIQRVVSGKGTQKRVREALDTSRAETVQADPSGVEDFLADWVNRTVALIAGQTQGDPSSCLEEANTAELFEALVQEGALPWRLVSVEGVPPQGWPAIAGMVHQAYASHGSAAASPSGEWKAGSNGRRKGPSSQSTEAWAWNSGWGGGQAVQQWGGSNGWADEPAPKRWKGGW